MNHKSDKHKHGTPFSSAFVDKYRERYDGTIRTPTGGTLLGSNGKPIRNVHGSLRDTK